MLHYYGIDQDLESVDPLTLIEKNLNNSQLHESFLHFENKIASKGARKNKRKRENHFDVVKDAIKNTVTIQGISESKVIIGGVVTEYTVEYKDGLIQFIYDALEYVFSLPDTKQKRKKENKIISLKVSLIYFLCDIF